MNRRCFRTRITALVGVAASLALVAGCSSSIGELVDIEPSERILEQSNPDIRYKFWAFQKEDEFYVAVNGERTCAPFPTSIKTLDDVTVAVRLEKPNKRCAVVPEIGLFVYHIDVDKIPELVTITLEGQSATVSVPGDSEVSREAARNRYR